MSAWQRCQPFGRIRSAPCAAQSGARRLLPSWNEGPAKQAIFDFVRATIDRCELELRPSAKTASPCSTRTARSGSSSRCTRKSSTVWTACRPLVAKKPELKNVEPFKTVLSGNREAIAKLSMRDLEKITRSDADRHDH